jgi:hypothetical protein
MVSIIVPDVLWGIPPELVGRMGPMRRQGARVWSSVRTPESLPSRAVAQSAAGVHGSARFEKESL